jgi:hypothetical protein
MQAVYRAAWETMCCDADGIDLPPLRGSSVV